MGLFFDEFQTSYPIRRLRIAEGCSKSDFFTKKTRLVLHQPGSYRQTKNQSVKISDRRSVRRCWQERFPGSVELLLHL
jgi:hypothetical protein